MQLAEDIWQESLLKQKHQEVNNSKDVVSELKHLGLNMIKDADTLVLKDADALVLKDADALVLKDADTDDEKFTKLSASLQKITTETPLGSLQLLENKRGLAYAKLVKEEDLKNIDALGNEVIKYDEKIDDIKKVENIISEATKWYKHWKKAGNIKAMVKWKKLMIEASNELQQGKVRTLYEIKENDKNISLRIEENMYNCLNNLSLLDVYQQMVKTLLHSPGENAAKLLSQDGDPQVFEQLLAEDASDLKLIDLPLPLVFKNQKLNDEFKTLRPFMINMSRYMVEKTAKYMETCVIHENHTHNKGQGGGPKLLFQSSKLYYKKEEKQQQQQDYASCMQCGNRRK
jgi:hypothetical protein